VLRYKGYRGRVEFDDEAEIFHGEVSGLRDVVTFEGRSGKELKKAFRDSIEEYLEFCKELGQEPDRPFSGKMLVRMPPDLHRDLHNTAAAQQLSLNALIVKLLEKRLEAKAL
jgi:predicted HicB family RNase H-like nuclease